APHDGHTSAFPVSALATAGIPRRGLPHVSHVSASSRTAAPQFAQRSVVDPGPVPSTAIVVWQAGQTSASAGTVSPHAGHSFVPPASRNRSRSIASSESWAPHRPHTLSALDTNAPHSGHR